MPDFIKDQDDQIRTKVLTALREIATDESLPYRGIVDWKEFTVTRTNDRKGYRDERDYVNTSPYQNDPKTLVRIEIELDDDTTPNFKNVVKNVKEAEAQAKKKAVQDRLDAALAEVDKAERELTAAKAAAMQLVREEN